MIALKDIKTMVADVLTENGFNVVASEVQEGFAKPAVFVDVFPSSVELLTCGGRTEQVTDSVEIKYISASETMEDCVAVSERLKKLFLYNTLSALGAAFSLVSGKASRAYSQALALGLEAHSRRHGRLLNQHFQV